jgi:3(or 17)beta-hydroxysteroid dehydrogenase
MARVAGKVVLITGGLSGIGAASAVMLAREGAQVIVTDITDTNRDKVLKAIGENGHAGRFYHQDVTSEEQWKTITDTILKEVGRLDAVVNSAGVGVAFNIEEATYEHFKFVNSVNYDGVFLGTKYGIAAIRRSGDHGGSIINLSSILGIAGDPNTVAYNGSKGGVRLLSKSAALHCAKSGYRIRVNTIHPGYIVTDMVKNHLDTQPDPKAAWGHLEGLHPVGHLGDPDDIAYAVVYLVSDESRFMTGAEMVIDGGYTAQ